jgi:hypothetical protein
MLTVAKSLPQYFTSNALMAFSFIVILGLLSSCMPTESPVQDGYCDKVSYVPGDTVFLHLNGKRDCETTVHLNDLSGNAVGTTAVDLRVEKFHNSQPWKHGFGYEISGSFVVPIGLESGIYRWEDKIPIVIREAVPKAKIIVVYDSNTGIAYSDAGGKSLYKSNLPDDTEKANVVSFQRPHQVFNYAFHFLHWFTNVDDEYDIAYISNFEMESYENLAAANLLILAGHSEYWTRKARTNFDRFVDAGGNAMVLSGNTMWWQVRYSDDHTQMICWNSMQDDPEPDTILKTLTYDTEALRFPTLPSIGLDFVSGGYGADSGGFGGYKIINPTSPLFNGLCYNYGDTLHCRTSEYDGLPISGFNQNDDPIIDSSALNFYRYELLGFDRAFRVDEGIGAFVLYQKSESAGIVINAGTTNWGEKAAFTGKSGFAIRLITLNMINSLLNDRKVFTDQALVGKSR